MMWLNWISLWNWTTLPTQDNDIASGIIRHIGITSLLVPITTSFRKYPIECNFIIYFDILRRAYGPTSHYALGIGWSALGPIGRNKHLDRTRNVGLLPARIGDRS